VLDRNVRCRADRYSTRLLCCCARRIQKDISNSIANVDKKQRCSGCNQSAGEITADGSYRESCKYLRDETLDGEAVSVYSDVMKSRLGIADSKVWISKTNGLVLQREVEVDMGAKGKGKQTIVFDYKKEIDGDFRRLTSEIGNRLPNITLRSHNT
jgi:hypothetical protein